ncbi:MAG: serine/threonine-protein kinase [Thermoanaerobaculia bacterium]|nr:serine/threonine-protein kinase [Thermoanaerobaculia bacterium]
MADESEEGGAGGTFGSAETWGHSEAGLAEGDASRSRSAAGEGERLGPYRLLELLGEGGFGSVYLAEQSEPVERRVALKLLKPGMDSRQVLARFEQERQALALMDHPGIAKVFDAGTTSTGRPFFVMEWVQGEPITAFCDRRRLPIRARLELFAQLCAAVQHAHSKGVIHRDLKPSNVLVSEVDGQPLAKVIDFGIAKATAGQLAERTLLTEHFQMIGTPEYMSPEQAGGSLDIDTRTDVYALGVLLYELLTGALPFDAKSLRAAAYGEMARIIREVDPPKPSTRLGRAAETLSTVAASRATEPARLSSALRGDLDWIVMKALEKERARRYETASGLAQDVRRHLAGEVVLAAPPSTAYRVRKFVRRHRLPVAAASAVAVALVLGLAGTAWQAKVASERADELRQVSAFQEAMLAQVDPTTAGVRLTEDVTRRLAAALEKAKVPEGERIAQVDSFRQSWARVNATDAATALIDVAILRPAVAAIEAQFEDQPAVAAQLRQALADRYRKLGLLDAALPLQESALATRRRVLGEDHPDTLTSIDSLGLLLQDRGQLAEAEPFTREALAKRRRALGEEHPDTLLSLGNMGVLLQAQGQLDEAERYTREALEKHRRVLGDEHPSTLISMGNLAVQLRLQGKLAEAEPLAREALEKRRRALGEEHPETLLSLNNLSVLLRGQGKSAEAEPFQREALEKYRRALGEEHPRTLNAIGNMAVQLFEQGKLAEAEPFYREALEKRRRVQGEDHPATLAALNNMGFFLDSQGRLAEAEPFYREALEKSRRVLGEEHPNTLAFLSNVGVLLRLQGRFAEAEPYTVEALATTRRALGEEHPDTLLCLNNMGVLREAQGRFAEAATHFREALETSRRVQGEESRATLVFTANLGRALELQGKHREAIDLLAAAEPAARQAFTGANARRLGGLLTTLGRARAGLGPDRERFALAEANLLEAHPLLVAAHGETHENTLECVRGLAALYAAWEKAEPGAGRGARAAEWRAKLASPPAPTGPR